MLAAPAFLMGHRKGAGWVQGEFQLDFIETDAASWHLLLQQCLADPRWVTTTVAEVSPQLTIAVPIPEAATLTGCRAGHSGIPPLYSPQT